MRGLSTLNSSRVKQKGSGLATLVERFSHRSELRNQNLINQDQINEKIKQSLPCAYHIGQKITNFCKNQNCLLPLCPKCVKIHSQQHSKMGMHGTFQTIQQCIEECVQIQSSTVSRLQQMVKLSEQMSNLHRDQLIICQSQLSKAKQQLVQYIDRIFQFYDEQMNRIILQTSKQYEESLVKFHKQIVVMLMKEKQISKKGQNNSTKLQFLIDFYSRVDMNTLLNNYSEKILQIKPKYIELSINTYQLERVKVILKKYLDFADFSQLIQNNLEKNLAYQRVTLVVNPLNQQHTRNQSNFSSVQNYGMTSDKQFTRSPIRNLFRNNYASNYVSPTSLFEYEYPQNSAQKYGFIQKGQIAKIIEERVNRESKLDTFKSPLQAYDLQKSRRSRI